MRLLVVAAIWLLITIAVFVFHGEPPPAGPGEETFSFWLLAPGRELSALVSGGPAGWAGAAIVIVGSWLTWTFLTFLVGESGRFALERFGGGRAK